MKPLFSVIALLLLVNTHTKGQSLSDHQEYERPKRFQFVKDIPKDFRDFGRTLTSRKSLPYLGAVIISSALTIPFDQQISDASQQFGRHIGLGTSRDVKTLIAFDIGQQHVTFFQVPTNLPSSMYFIGEGWTSVFTAGSFFLYGKAKKDNRALMTGSEIIEAMIVMGFTTQLLKRISGRQSPFVADVPGGRWRPFTNLKDYQNNVPQYDAFPSGHLATVTATLVIIAKNYPDSKLIKPIGGSLALLMAYQMINNGVHWAGDYPLAIALGFAYASNIVNRNLPSRKLSKWGLKNRPLKITPAIGIAGSYGITIHYNL